MNTFADNTGNDPTTEGEGVSSELTLLHDAAQKDLGRQLEIVGVLDNKSAILVALDTGVLILAGSFPGAATPQGLVTAALVLIVLGLCASLASILPLPLHLYLRRNLLTEIKEQGMIDKPPKVLDQLIDHAIYNRPVITWKFWSSFAATVLSIMGFLLIGIAQIIKVAIP